MWIYEKRLQYPVNIKKTCPKTASLIISQFGGPDGELAASMRYLSQRYTMPCREAAGLLTDIGTEELAHLEIICAMVFQLTKDLTAVPRIFVRRNTSGSSIERSTWLSAAKFTTMSGFSSSNNL